MRYLFALLTIVTLATSCKHNEDDSTTPIPNNKAVTWIKSFGGSNYDFAKAVVQLPNGHYVMAGTTRSTDGDVPGSRVGYDTWLAEIDTAGNKIWSNAFGTNADEHTSTMIKSNDGGFVIVGYVGFNFDTTSNQAWIIKTNSTGNVVWRKDFVASQDSKLTDVVALSDGNLVAAGYTTSTAGRDGWLLKLDPGGNQVWSKTFGGNGNDEFSALTKGNDGGFIAVGSTASSDGNMSGTKGSYDGWIFKADDAGTLVWSKNYGGSGRDYLKALTTSAGGYVAVGNSTSSNGDLPSNRGNFDEWVIRFDTQGNKQWVKTFGGSNDEYITGVVATPDGGLLSIGYTNSYNGDVNRNSGDFGGWLIKLDASGNKTASSTYGNAYDELVDDVITTSDGGYIIAGQTFDPSRTYDAWMVKIGAL